MPEVGPAVSTGIENHCPFCRGRVLNWPAPGCRIQSLTGYQCGWTGTVAPKETWLEGDEFCVQFDHDPPGVLHRVLLRQDQFALEPIGPPPLWLPPLSTDDLAYVDEAVIRVCAALFQKGKWRWRDEELDEELYMLVARSWQRRLPVFGEEVWKMCDAHGMPQCYKNHFVKTFDFGVGLLVFSHRRPSIKRRRVQAMSIGRYEPLRRNREK